MRVQAFVGRPGFGVGYLVWDMRGGAALVVDAPPGVRRKLIALVEEHALRVAYIVSTHGHWDSCADLAVLAEDTGAPICAHTHDATRLANPDLTLEPGSQYHVRGCRADNALADGDEIEIGRSLFRVMHTPGHTPGSISLYDETRGLLFTGDTLLAGLVGTTDHPGGNADALTKSLHRLSELPPRTRVFPAHGKDTVLAEELWLLRLAV